MTGKQFVFVQALPLGKSRREQELEQAKARSHAAKVVHKRAKDTDRGYQQLMKILLGPQVGDLITAKVNEHLANGSVDVFPDDKLADHSQTQPPTTYLPPSRQEVVVQQSLTRRALIPSYGSLRRGNSDPFNAFAVPVNSKTNALMKYTREFYLPTLARDASNPNSLMRPEEWPECISLLKDACTAYAHLTRVAAFMSQPGHWDRNVAAFMSQPGHWGKNDELSRQALVFNGKGTTLLRERIERGIMDRNTLYVMSCFLAAELYGQNFTVAKYHARILGKLFPQLKGPVDYNLLHNVLRLDSTLTVMSLTRPSFDVETWIPEVFAPYFKPLLATLPETISLEAIHQTLDGSIINDDSLKDLIARLRQILLIYLCSVVNPIYAGLEYLFYIRHVVFVNMSRFVNRYLDAESICQKQTTFDPVITGRAQVQAYSSLAAILWCRNTTTEAYYTAEGAVAGAEELMVTQFKEKITESEWMVSEPAQGGFANTRLWALYVGAYLEHFEAARIRSRESVSKAWFNSRLAHQATSLGLTSWEQLRERLLHFLHADLLQPHGSMWFAQTMEANKP